MTRCVAKERHLKQKVMAPGFDGSPAQCDGGW